MANPLGDLGRRERQIMDVLFQLGQASAAQVRGALPDPPSYSAVRGMLRLLEEKGFVSHEWDGPRHTYRPTADPAQAQRSAARHLLQTFFNNSMESAVAAMLGATDRPPTPDELDRLSQLIEQARRRKGGGSRK
ncbi:MAG TPA: BlaI/MecI/CopY family transcriptional regulator [Gemmatimonadaceae bacterium]|nr:BlaI/MecI/CopY family transcriptional regulator [Gemmatimonadaceae bacterium]